MDLADAVISHDIELAAHGGSAGIRDQGLLESALARPKNIWAYAETSPPLTTLAAAYAYGLFANHAFIDGNKRTALVVSFTFLEVNGFEVTATQEEAYLAFWALAAGEISEAELAVWFAHHTASL
jgi:death-on-curing protein